MRARASENKRGEEGKAGRTWMIGTGASSLNMSLNGTNTPWSAHRSISSCQAQANKRTRTESRTLEPPSILSPRLKLVRQPRRLDTAFFQDLHDTLGDRFVPARLEGDFIEFCADEKARASVVSCACVDRHE